MLEKGNSSEMEEWTYSILGRKQPTGAKGMKLRKKTSF